MSGRDEPFPPHAYIPGGPWPRPGTGGEVERPAPIVGERWMESAAYHRGVGLFNAGYYWEAHEVWEGLWHAHGRRGATADALKGLIKLAAAGVKVRQRRPRGVRSIARRAADDFRRAREQGGRDQLGLDLDQWIGHALDLAADPPGDPGAPGEPVVRVFDFRIEPR